MTKLFHLSFTKDLKTLKPRIPDNQMTRLFGENATVPRICCGRDPDACFRGLGELTYDKTLYLYELEVKDYYIPSIDDVPDVKFSNEIWVLVETNCIMTTEFKVSCIDNNVKIEVIEEYV